MVREPRCIYDGEVRDVDVRAGPSRGVPTIRHRCQCTVASYWYGNLLDSIRSKLGFNQITFLFSISPVPLKACLDLDVETFL